MYLVLRKQIIEDTDLEGVMREYEGWLEILEKRNSIKLLLEGKVCAKSLWPEGA